jgi:hypothetical protein
MNELSADLFRSLLDEIVLFGSVHCNNGSVDDFQDGIDKA